MKVLRWINYILILAFLSSCSAGEPGGSGLGVFGPSATNTPLPTAPVGITPAPDAQAVITQYLQAYQKNDFAAMYEMLAKSSRAAITLEDFVKRHNVNLRLTQPCLAHTRRKLATASPTKPSLWETFSAALFHTSFLKTASGGSSGWRA